MVGKILSKVLCLEARSDSNEIKLMLVFLPDTGSGVHATISIIYPNSLLHKLCLTPENLVNVISIVCHLTKMHISCQNLNFPNHERKTRRQDETTQQNISCAEDISN